jgi:hypothetical protein
LRRAAGVLSYTASKSSLASSALSEMKAKRASALGAHETFDGGVLAIVRRQHHA